MWQRIKDTVEEHLFMISLSSIGISIVLFIVAMTIFFNKESPQEETIIGNEAEMFLSEKSDTSETESAINEEAVDTTTQVVYVDVKGAVQQPGVYQATPGMRLIDAVDLAGGFLISADQSQVNLALKLEDQMVVYIPHTGEEISEISQGVTTEETTEEETGKININTADTIQLQTLNGIGEKKAELIIQYREENGSFQKIEELKNVSGIGEKTFDALKDFVVIGSE